VTSDWPNQVPTKERILATAITSTDDSDLHEDDKYAFHQTVALLKGKKKMV
jgi:hypothetical protein